MVEVAEGTDQDRIDEKATLQCECETASMLKFFSAAGMYEDDEQGFCLDIIRAMKSARFIDSMSFKYAGETFTLTQMADGRTKIKRRRTEQEERKF